MRTPACPLCQSAPPEEFHRDPRRDYFRCRTCSLVFVPPEQFLSAEAEKAEYDRHRNTPDDPGYRRFLSRLFNPLQKHLKPCSRGLDFGSGPGPALSVMLEEAGHPMRIYDPFYADSPEALDKKYDFITATEVLEHLHQPQLELERLWAALLPGGCLGIMTKLVLDRRAFSRWHYKNDLTHVCFFSRETFRWLAAKWAADLFFTDKDVIIIYKK